MRNDDRQAFLHKGPGDTVFSGYVEIHFDNSDKRFPLDSTEVVLRRALGLKKDEYYLNNKHISPDEVINLFESAGFSRSNPYNIVMQGQIQAMAKISPAARLELLKEVAGARVYDEKRSESFRILQDTVTKREKIDQVLAMLEERLSELDAERDELKEYQQFDRDRRALEYTLKNIELNEVNRRLLDTDQIRSQEALRANQVHAVCNKTSEELRVAEKEIKSCQLLIAQLTNDKELAQTELNECLQIEVRDKLQLQDAQDVHNKRGTQRQSLVAKLSQLDERISKAERDLSQLEPEYRKAMENELSLKAQCADVQRRLGQLVVKQGRNGQFNTASQRDQWIQKEMKQIQVSIDAKRKQCVLLQQEIDELNLSVKQNEQILHQREAGIQQRRNQLADIAGNLNEVREKRDTFTERRKQLWHRENEFESQILNARQDMARAERQLESSMSREQSQGLAAVRRLANELQLQRRIFGPLIELFEIQDEYVTAVEVTCGNALFHVVVDTDATAAKLLNRMNEDRSGRVTFIPLNCLKLKSSSTASSFPVTEQVQPLLNVITYDHVRFDKAFQQILGKTLLCQSLEIGTQLASMHNASCVTLDGDRVNRKGALTGGFYDTRFSRIRAIKELKLWRTKLSSQTQELSVIRVQLSEIDQRVTELVCQFQQLELTRTKAQSDLELFLRSSSEAQRELNFAQELLTKQRAAISERESSISALEQSKLTLKDELGTKLLSQLTHAEVDEQKELTTKLEQLVREEATASSLRSSLEGCQTEFRSALNSRLKPQRLDLEKSLTTLDLGDMVNQDLGYLTEEHSRFESALSDARQRYKHASKELVATTERMEALKKEIDVLREKETINIQKMQEESKQMEKLLNTRSSLVSKKNDVSRRLREIGSLPSQALAKFADIDYTSCMTKLRETKQSLSKYSHVNKKALDQYLTFAEERERFNERKKQMDADSSAIEKLIQTLDMQKDEAVERTFKAVSKYFSEVFAELINGKATLIMQKQDIQQQQPPFPSGDSQGNVSSMVPRIRQYTGVDIRVSFANQRQSADGPRKFEQLNQLSGGQQSVVALALIFAIQRCDPAPFYIFDEIDPALDDRHRMAVANMIKKQSEHIQFIVVTHRPEMIQIANKNYIISYQNRVSQIMSASQEEALAFVKTLEDEVLVEKDHDQTDLPEQERTRPQPSMSITSEDHDQHSDAVGGEDISEDEGDSIIDEDEAIVGDASIVDNERSTSGPTGSPSAMQTVASHEP